jgi:putative transposase
MIDGAGLIYKHCIALHRKYSACTGKSLNKLILMKHLTQRKQLDRYPH